MSSEDEAAADQASTLPCNSNSFSSISQVSTAAKNTFFAHFSVTLFIQPILVRSFISIASIKGPRLIITIPSLVPLVP